MTRAGPPSPRSPRAVNAALAGLALLLLGVSLVPAVGQTGPARARGEYTLAAGKTITGPGQALYVVDGINQELLVFRWDSSRREFVGQSYRDLGGDARGAVGR